jgi:hypothetical protein
MGGPGLADLPEVENRRGTPSAKANGPVTPFSLMHHHQKLSDPKISNFSLNE